VLLLFLNFEECNGIFFFDGDCGILFDELFVFIECFDSCFRGEDFLKFGIFLGDNVRLEEFIFLWTMIL
jgi:hypothetical protein